MTQEWFVAHNGVPDHMDRGELAVDMFVAFVAEDLKEQLGEYAPEGETGNLSGSFGARRVSDREYVVSSDDPAAEWVRSGTGVYAGNGPLTPKTAGALTFFWPKIGRKTAWKGGVKGEEAAASFYRWAIARGMVPFFAWPRGQKPQDYVGAAMASTEAEIPELSRQAFVIAGADG